MKEAQTNFIIDAIMFLGMMLLPDTGFVRKHILWGGSTSRAVYGKKLDMNMWGFSRDDWSLIHLDAAYFLLVLLALHIFRTGNKQSKLSQTWPHCFQFLPRIISCRTA